MRTGTNRHLRLRQLERWAPWEMSTRAKISRLLRLINNYLLKYLFAPSAHLPRCAFPKSSFAPVPIFLTVHSSELPNCLFHQNPFTPSAHSLRYPFDQCSTAHLPQVPINNTTRSRHGEHYKAEWSAHWTANLVSANLVSPGRSAKSSIMMLVLLH